MGTYFALMDEAAKRGEDYEILDQISETLRRIEKGTAKPDEVSQVIESLNEFEGRIAALVNQATPTKAMEEKTGRTREVLKHLEALKEAIRSAAGSSWSAAHT
jgi:CRISPR/Cas system-associated endonuclease Cas1